MKILNLIHTRIVFALFFVITGYSQQYKEVFSNNSYKEYSLSELENTLDYIKKNIKTLDRVETISFLEHIIQTSEDFSEAKDIKIRARCYNVLGKINFLHKNYQSAIKNHKVAEIYLKKIDDAVDLAIEVNNDIAQVYIEGYNKPGKALMRTKYLYENSDHLDEDSKHIVKLNLAGILIQALYHSKAYELLQSCKHYFRDRPEHVSYLARTYAKLADCHKFEGNFDLALSHYQEAARISENNKLFRQAMTVYAQYVDLLQDIGRKDLAFDALTKYTKHQQTALDFEKLEALRYKEQLIATEIKNTLASQKANDSKTFSVFILSILVLCLGVFLFFSYNHKRTRMLSNSLAVKNKELEKAKAESDKLAAIKTKFTSTVSHELRTPLYGVVGLTSILMDSVKDKENKHFIKLMQFSANHLLNLINDVLQVTKMESQNVILDESPCELRTVADNIKNSFEYQIEQSGNTLHLTLDSEIPKMLIFDSVRLSQILINLISNANKFTKNGKIWVSFKNPVIHDNQVDITFEIRDNGRGIPLDKQEMIFEKFSQADPSDHYNGTGLGLNIVQKLVRLYGGEIKLYSELGKGSTFYFTITFDIANDQGIAKSKTRLTNYKPFKSGKDYDILIVEDNKINQIVTQKILNIKEFNTAIADDGLIAVKMMKQKKYDAVLMDLNMPNMDGREATKKIREFDIRTPIIALTASDTKETIDSIMDSSSGFNDYLKKPFKNEEFFETIEVNISKGVSRAS